jgi:hypothetical protein
MLFKGSRYQNVATNTITNAAGQQIVYLEIRFIPETDGVVGYTVKQGDRLDLISNRSYRDPQHFWRICDANLAMWPDDLLIVNNTLEIPPSEG